MTATNQSLILREKVVAEDSFGNLSLLDIWRAAGAPGGKTAPHWRALPTTDEYITAVAENIGKSYDKQENDYKSVIYSKTGRGGGTFAHILVALAYAEYLSADLAIEVRTIYLRYRSGDITLADEVLAKADKAREFEDNRDISKSIRERYENVVKDHGGAIGHCTNAIYKVLLGGTKKQIAEDRGLPANVLFRDKLELGELLKTMSTEHMASDRIEDLAVKGHAPCMEASRRAAKIVNDAFERERRDRRNPEPDL